MTPSSLQEMPQRPVIANWRTRLALLFLFLVAGVTIWTTNWFLTARFTDNTRNQAELRMALYSGNLISELRRSAIVPQLLAKDPELINALETGDFSQSTARLISFVEEIGASSLFLLDETGRTVAATNRTRLGVQYRNQEFFVNALRSNVTLFTVAEDIEVGTRFIYSRRLDSPGHLLGVIAVEVDLQKFERTWAGISEAVFVKDSQGKIILSSEPRWRGLNEEEALARQPAQGAIDRAIQATADWTQQNSDIYIQGEAMMRKDTRIPFRGWHMTSFTTYDDVRQKVNAVLALEIMVFAILLALAFYLLSRKNASRMATFQKESVELRALNRRLQREISERERMQQSLAVAEQSLAQSSKLAALGEMSAAVSHELNQPLAAMKTYLAGAKLLLGRNRHEEAEASFQRIDDLIGRMGSITKQLKSFARKGGEEFQPVDLVEAVASATSMMEPQLRQREIHIQRILPQHSVRVMGDRVRLEQVIINLLRNALDATKSVNEPEIEILLAAGETATLTVRDNGTGIENLDDLFEPFFTTKQPGEGVGLGLAISSGIVNDLGGRLTARNGQEGGAVFEVQLPILTEDIEAAE